MKIAKNICTVIGVIGFLLMLVFSGKPTSDCTLTLAQQVGAIFGSTGVMCVGYIGHQVFARICEVRRYK